MVVQVLGLQWGEVVQRLVGAETVAEIDPAQGRDLDLGDVAPGPFRTDQLSLEQPDRGLGERVVVGVVIRPDRRIDSRLAGSPTATPLNRT